MPMQQLEFARSVGGGRVTATFEIGERERPHSPQTLNFQVWFRESECREPLLVVNPSLDITLLGAGPQSSRRTERAVRLPISTGELGNSGGFLSGHALVWRPFAYLPAEMILRLDALRDLEHGLYAEFTVNAGLLSLSSKPRDPGGAALPTVTDAFHWKSGFAVPNDLWRELLGQMGWPTPRVFELHPLSFSDLHEFNTAAEALREAERLMFQGHLGESIAKSRIVVEAVFRKLGHKGKGNFDWKSIVAEGLPGDMAEVFRALNNVTVHEHHPTGADTRWLRADARFLLQLAATLAEYAGTLPLRTPPAS
ncbi:MAG: hypothetical protein Q8P18_21435 [Pseudomonadota bacterium]|nr:hypothetical protein [Pseudomonadota bacterium]